MNPVLLSLDVAARDQVHQCLEARLPNLHQQLLGDLGVPQEEISKERAKWAAQAGLAPEFQALHLERPYKLEFDFDADEVFPLLCPVREDDWIAGWKSVCKLLHSQSGIAEEGCVFSTYIPGEGRSVWICSDYDRVTRRIEYIKHIEGLAIVKWQMRVEKVEPQRSVIVSHYAMTGLSELGNQYVSRFIAEGYPHMLESILKAKISYYLRTGEMMLSEEWQPQ